jgi:hypothetical protein
MSCLPRIARLLVMTTLVVLGVAWSRPADAFSTRVHIAIANDVRDSLIAGGGKTITLRFSDGVVRIGEADARAITTQPLAFRAGAIGPDNMIFPGMTDPSHAVWQRPFEQCELLYRAAVSDEERAYALGCFLHGSTDAIAHHFVNYLTGETFTLTPLASGRQQQFTNVIRHIAAESLIEDALLASDPNLFQGGALTHSIPIPFVQRTYFDREHELYKLLAARSYKRYTRARTAKPAGRLQDVLAISALEPADHLVLAPEYFVWIDDSLDAFRRRFEALQDGSTPDGAKLQVGAGADGKKGTTDDTTGCTTSCAQLAAEYFLYTHLFAPRYDASGRQLESAFAKVTAKLHDDLNSFVPAYLQVVDGLSTKLNTPYRPGEKRIDFDSLDVETLLKPLQDWAVRTTTIDWDVLARSVMPDAWVDFHATLKRIGLAALYPAEVLRAAAQPLIDPIRDTVKDFIVAQGTEYLRDFTASYRETYEASKREYADRLRQAAPAGGSTILDDVRSSGLYGQAFNVAAAAIADHAAVLPTESDDPIGLGPASFDTSFSAHWMQVGLCEPLRKKVLPLGVGIKGLLSISKEEGVLEANVTDEARIECHDGSLTEFARTPTKESCNVVEQSALLSDARHRGSLTRGYPPELSANPAKCVTNRVGWLTNLDGLTAEEEDALRRKTTTETTSCSAASTKSPANAGTAAITLVALSALGLLARGRRRGGRNARLAAAAALALAASACTKTTTTEEEEIIPGDKGDGTLNDPNGPSRPGTNGEPTAASMSPAARELFDKLGTSTWRGAGTRNGKKRVIELSFRAGNMQWAEVQNPFGPARKRELRALSIADDGLVRTTVTNPAGWTDATINGVQGEYRLRVVDGSPRHLTVTNAKTNESEEYVEGAVPTPTSGLTAIVRTFASAGVVDEAFCRASNFESVDYAAMLTFARYGGAKSAEKETAVDFIVGAQPAPIKDASGQNRFAVTDIHGFDRFGGTNLSDQQNFFVYYTGAIAHPGGTFRMRELDDAVTDGAWAFLGPQVGSTQKQDLFLEVTSRVWADATYDVASRAMPAGKVPIEIVIARCTSTVKAVTIEGQIDSGAWMSLDQFPLEPKLDATLLAPAF